MKFISNKFRDHQKGERKQNAKKCLQYKKKEPPFQQFLLENNETKKDKVMEHNEINFEEVTNHLEKGESIFITQ